jgi:putative intracellular protease/amidase
MSANVHAVKSQAKRVLMVVASPSVSTTLGGPVGFWASELVHPYCEFTEAGYTVELASPQGGKVELDALSDPRDASGYSANDLLSRGFLTSPPHAALLENTKKLSEVRAGDYDALVVCGGQSPMFTFREDLALQQLVRDFFEAGKVTAALCHGTAALLDVKLSDGTFLLAGRTMTGFANVEEDYVDSLVGRKMMPFRIEDEARRRGANYIQAGAWRPYAVQDGHLITGQQQHSGRETAKLVIASLGR